MHCDQGPNWIWAGSRILHECAVYGSAMQLVQTTLGASTNDRQNEPKSCLTLNATAHSNMREYSPA
eukprot:6708766-Alexandrium_andersonii.AAC.1